MHAINPWPHQGLACTWPFTLCYYTFSHIIDPTTCSCPSNYFLNSHQKCQCMATNWCSNGLTWDPHERKCICDKHNQHCAPGFTWIDVLCRCIIMPGLSALSYWATLRCNSVQMCTYTDPCLDVNQICPIGLSWDPENCDCNSEYW